MRLTRHTTSRSLTTTGTPTEVYAAIENLSTFPKWWDSEKPSSFEGSETRVVTEADDAIARPGLVIDVERAAGSATFRSGRSMSWAPETRQFLCEVAEPSRRVRLLRQPADAVPADGVRAIDITIESRDLRSLITIQRESEISGGGVRAAVQRWAHNRPIGLRAPLSRLVARVEQQHIES